MSIESISENLFLKCRSIAGSGVVNFAGIDITLHDFIKKFAYVRKLDTNKVRPELKNRAKALSESGVVNVHGLSRKVKRLLSLRAGFSEINNKAIISFVKFLGFIPSQEFCEKDNLIAALEGYGFVSYECAEKSGSGPQKIYRPDIQKRDSALHNAIGRIGKEFEGTINFSAGIRELGFRPCLGCHSERTILETLQKVWPYALVKEAYEENNPSLLVPWDEFKDKNKIIFWAIQHATYAKKHRNRQQKKAKKFAHIIPVHYKKRINSIYPEFPDLFNFISRKIHSVDIKSLAGHIQTARRLGKNISPRALHITKDPGLKKIRNELRRFAADNGLTIQGAIRKVTQLSVACFASPPEQNYAIGEISELATRVVLLSTQLIDSTGKFYENGFDKYFAPIHAVMPRLKKKVKLTREENNAFIFPDFLVENESVHSIVEVKSGTGTTCNTAINLIAKYSSRSFKELNGADSKIVAVLQMPANITNQVAPYLEDQNISVIDGKTFIDYFFKAMRKLERSPYRAFVANAVPNKRHSLVNLVELHKRIIEEPHIMITPAHERLILNHAEVLRILSFCLEYAVENKSPVSERQTKYPPINSVLNKNCYAGRIAICEGRRYFNANAPLNKIRIGNRIIPTAKYVADSLKYWKNGRLCNSENNDFFIPLKDVMFLDIENTGLKNNAPIFLIGAGYYDSKKDDFVFEGFFARDGYEEEAILSALNKKNKKYVVTFNGGSFDMPRLSRRFDSYILNHFWSKESHLDILPAISPFVRQNGLENSRLSTLEEFIFGFNRPEDDVKGRDIPFAYRNYCRGGDPEPLGRILRHNMMDIAATAAGYVFLLRNPEFFNRNCLENFKAR